MDEYRELVASLPLPSSDQTSRFVDYVSGAHSWYKHLPLFPPGAPFVFFLDPNAGRDIVVSSEGVVFRDRADLFHYSMLQTGEYRERYGCWQYATEFVPTFASGGGLFVKFRPGANVDLESLAAQLRPEGVVYQNRAVDVLAADRWLPVPQEILENGLCFLTGLVDEHFMPRNDFPDNPVDGLGTFRELAEEHSDHEEVHHYQPFVELAERYRGATGETRQQFRREMERWHAEERPRQRQKIQASTHPSARRAPQE